MVESRTWATLTCMEPSAPFVVGDEALVGDRSGVVVDDFRSSEFAEPLEVGSGIGGHDLDLLDGGELLHHVGPDPVGRAADQDLAASVGGVAEAVDVLVRNHAGLGTGGEDVVEGAYRAPLRVPTLHPLLWSSSGALGRGA
ncbi:hypothetical protein Z951_15735 [Streptomyces sp. PRh5]|nr:hypothetical protein Z951_15735 [Streptomyces sp. PRh5]